VGYSIVCTCEVCDRMSVEKFLNFCKAKMFYVLNMICE
jgi:hypothetical protein